MSDLLQRQITHIAENMKAGKIDIEAGMNAIEQVRAQIEHELVVAKAAMPAGARRAPFGDTVQTEGQQRGGWARPSAKLAMRMGWVETGMSHRYNIHFTEQGGFIFVQGVVNGEMYGIKCVDDNLFPNDELITQLRMLYDAK